MNKKLLLGVFSDEDKLVNAFEALLHAGIKPDEVYTPYPIHEILEGMGKKTKITTAAFFFGLFGAVGILSFLYWAAVISWPLNFGGKPSSTFPSFIVVTIVATILTVTLLTLFTFSARAKIFPGKKAEVIHEGATNDKFVMVFGKESVAEKLDSLNKILKENGVEEVIEK